MESLERPPNALTAAADWRPWSGGMCPPLLPVRSLSRPVLVWPCQMPWIRLSINNRLIPIRLSINEKNRKWHPYTQSQSIHAVRILENSTCHMAASTWPSSTSTSTQLTSTSTSTSTLKQYSSTSTSTKYYISAYQPMNSRGRRMRQFSGKTSVLLHRWHAQQENKHCVREKTAP